MARWRCLDCPAVYGARLSRCPRCGSAKGLVMALNECEGCTTRFAVGLKRCPQCSSKDFHEEGSMPKITRHGGASDKTLPVPEAEPTDVAPAAEAQVEFHGEHGPEIVDLPVGAQVYEARSESEGGEEPSPGSSSSASTETPPTNSEPSEAPSPKRARTTANRSRKGQTDNSSAASTAGDQTEATSASDEH